jgi:hypothetical protein
MQPKIRTVRDHPRGPYAVWRWEWVDVEHSPVGAGGD